MPLQISSNVSIPDEELTVSYIRASGPGGQNVNKVSSAVHLRFDIEKSSLPAFYKERLLKLSDQRISGDGVIVIKADRFRTREKNREDALNRLLELIKKATVVQKKRRPTKPTRSSQKKRMDRKTQRGKTKALRGRIQD